MPGTLPEFWMLAAEAENRAADYHRALAATLSIKDERLAQLFTQAANDEADCAREAASRTSSLVSGRRKTADPTLLDGLALLEESFERYLDIAERANDECVVREAQSLAARSIRRLSMVYGSLADDLTGTANDVA